MREAIFTKGQWVRSPFGKSVAAIRTVCGPQGAKRLQRLQIATVIDPQDSPLIAAAPDLYEALAQCHAIFIGDDTETPIAQMVDAALAKARGEQ
jgi:hypothetical protein